MGEAMMMTRRQLGAGLAVATASLLAGPIALAADAGASAGITAATLIAPAAAAGTAEPPSPRPSVKKPAKGKWPFRRWSYAKAYTYNFFQDRPVPLELVARDGRRSPHIRSEQLLTETQASKATVLVHRSRGTFETSSCTFPRHAVVFFDRADTPVAAASICFECEGVLVWPDYRRDDDATPQAYLKREKKFSVALDGWKALFGGELGLPLSYDGAR